MALDPVYNSIYPLHDDKRSFPTPAKVVSCFHSITSYEDMGLSQIMNSVHGLLQFIHVSSYGFRHSCSLSRKVDVTRDRTKSSQAFGVSFRGSLLDTPTGTVIDVCPSPFDVGQPRSTNAAPWFC
jgi:hypothetical protein